MEELKHEDTLNLVATPPFNEGRNKEMKGWRDEGGKEERKEGTGEGMQEGRKDDGR
jgi:hypothetical protein